MDNNQTLEINAEYREEFGKGFARRFRASGKIPISVNCSSGKSISIVADNHNICIRKDMGSLLYSIVKVKTERESFDAIVNEIQVDPVKGSIKHITLRKIDSDIVKTDLVLYYTNSVISPGIKRGGVFNILHRTIPVLCNKENIVRSIEIDISNMELGDIIRATDINLPETFKLHKSMNPSSVISRIVGSKGKLAALQQKEGDEDAKTAATKPAAAKPAAAKPAAAKPAAAKPAAAKPAAKK